mgnify:CR=1 FL=1
MSDKKKILIVDDSKMIRKGLAGIFEKSGLFEIVGEAADGKEALAAIKKLQPDVVTLDVVMPGMDGLTTLKHIMIECPRPTVMLSSLTQDGSETTFDALRYGAVDFISKPSRLENPSMEDLADEILNKPGALSPEEFDEMKNHVHYGVNLLRNTPGIKETIINIVLTHHERYDGSGYPSGLKGKEEPVDPKRQYGIICLGPAVSGSFNDKRNVFLLGDGRGAHGCSGRIQCTLACG